MTQISELERSAKRAYEIGRTRHGLKYAFGASPLALLAYAECGPKLLCLIGSFGLISIAFYFGYRGQTLERALKAGLGAGLLAFALPMVACSVSVMQPWILPICFAGGLASGLMIGLRSFRLKADRLTFLSAASLVVLAAGTLGCALAGVGGVAGMMLGVGLTTVPAAIGARA